MRLHYHLIVAAPMGLVVYLFSGLTIVSICTFIAGVSLDVDHFLDFLLWSKSKSIHAFFSQSYWIMPHVSDNLLHSYEILPILWILCLLLQRFDLAVGLTLGFSAHMILDEIGNRKLPRSYYFFVSRFFIKRRLAAVFMEVKRRHNHKCYKCERETRLEIHSLGGFSYNPKNYIPLCPRCHAKEHGKKTFSYISDLSAE